MEREQEFVVVSTWKSVDDWNRWLSNKQRAEIQEKIDALLEKKTRYTTYLYG